jgi:cyclopropane fatty-acyl-phospholipid synthase-like methyltransferase
MDQRFILVAGQATQTEKVMSDNVTLFPNILQPANALKAYAPIGVKFWENQESVLKGWKEFADGWFSRRQVSAQTALEAAKHIGDANASSDIFREYQNWFTRAMELLAEDGKAYQQQVLRAGAQLSARPEERQTG